MLFRSSRHRAAPHQPEVGSILPEAKTGALRDQAIGEILRNAKGLSPVHLEQILEHQREHGGRFGEAAISLGIVSREDVMWALSQQFHYHYAAHVAEGVHEDLVMAKRPFSEDMEIFRDLRSHLTLGVLAPKAERRALALVSADVGDGKTFICANLALAFSQLLGRTLIVDADMRAPRMHELFGVEADSGLSSILAGRSDAGVIHAALGLPNLYLLPAGTVPPNPLELLHRPAFALLIQEMLKKFDHVFVDTPAAACGSDGRMIASTCGAAVIVGRKNMTRTSLLQTLASQLSKGPTTIAGVVMNEF
jgi:protein-tyrosine kinase